MTTELTVTDVLALIDAEIARYDAMGKRFGQLGGTETQALVLELLKTKILEAKIARVESAAPAVPAPTTDGAMRVGDRVKHHDGTIGTVFEISDDGWIGIVWDKDPDMKTFGNPKFMSHYYDQPVPAPVPSPDSAAAKIKLSKAQRKALEMLSERPRQTGRSFYNSYIPGNTAQSLEKLGLAQRKYGPGTYPLYAITDAGRAALAQR